MGRKGSQLSRALAPLAEDPDLVPSTHMIYTCLYIVLRGTLDAYGAYIHTSKMHVHIKS